MAGPMSNTGVSGVIKEAWDGKKKPKNETKPQSKIGNFVPNSKK